MPCLKQSYEGLYSLPFSSMACNGVLTNKNTPPLLKKKNKQNKTKTQQQKLEPLPVLKIEMFNYKEGVKPIQLIDQVK